jgi:hypothetical protein
MGALARGVAEAYTDLRRVRVTRHRHLVDSLSDSYDKISYQLTRRRTRHAPLVSCPTIRRRCSC